MFIYSLASLIPLTVLLALIVVSGRAIWLAVMPPRRCVKEASCEKCKYPVAGLSTWTCPECGTDLLMTGIITRSMEMRRRGSYLAAIAGLVTLVLCGIWIGLLIASQTIGVTTGPSSLPPTTQTTRATPSSGLYRELKITQNGDTSSPTSSLSASLEIEVSGGTHTMNIDVSGGLYFWVMHPDGRTGSSGRFDCDTLTKWFKSAGIDVSSAVSAREIGELEDMISAWPGPWIAPTNADLPSFQITATSASNFYSEIVPNSRKLYFIVFWSIPAVGSALFVLFTVLIVRRRSKLLREADQPLSRPNVTV
jgi:hypothetical protein